MQARKKKEKEAYKEKKVSGPNAAVQARKTNVFFLQKDLCCSEGSCERSIRSQMSRQPVYKIYKDINDVVYIGSTCDTLSKCMSKLRIKS